MMTKRRWLILLSVFVLIAALVLSSHHRDKDLCCSDRVGREKTAASYKNGILYINYDGMLCYWKDGALSFFYHDPVFPPLCVIDNTVWVKTVTADSVGLLSISENNTVRTYNTEFDDILYIENNTVYGEKAGYYSVYDYRTGQFEELCELPRGSLPLFYYQNCMYFRDMNKIYAVNSEVTETALPIGVQFVSDDQFYGNSGDDGIFIITQDSSVKKLGMSGDLLCAAPSGFLWHQNNVVYYQDRASGEDQSRALIRASLGLNTSLPGPQFQLCDDFLFFRTVTGTATAMQKATVQPAFLSLSPTANVSYYLYDLKHSQLIHIFV